jgi:hypothetical protein
MTEPTTLGVVEMFDHDTGHSRLPLLGGMLGAAIGLKMMRARGEAISWQAVGAVAALGYYAGLGWCYERRADASRVDGDQELDE